MATDSTELTFVRCPSCRSLVPAVSTRCRMCGATLDSSQKGDDAEKDQKKSSRVRQRTMSQPESELSSAADKIREEISDVSGEEKPPSAPGKPKQPFGVHEMEIDGAADPLSEYIEEIEAEEEPGLEVAGSAKTKPGANAQSASSGPAPSAAEVVRPGAATPPAKTAPLGGPVGLAQKAPGAESASPPPQTNLGKPAFRPQDSAVQPGEPQPRVLVESGPRRPGRHGGLSFGKPRDEMEGPRTQAAPGAVDRSSHPASAPGADRAPVDKPPQGAGPFGGGEAPKSNASQAAASGRPEELRQRPPERPFEQRENRPAVPPPAQQPRPRPAEQPFDERRGQPMKDLPALGKSPEGIKREEAVSGRLFGWLVSYLDPNGSAQELREAKFFISRSSLKETDLIIEDKSISTPHALVSVSLSEGLRIQDLMSDRGVFVRRRGGDAYQRIEETAKIEHGDWVRFGDVEFLVSLIAHVGMK